jgi:hypothetical protein
MTLETDLSKRVRATGYLSREAERRVDERVKEVRARQQATLRAIRKAHHRSGDRVDPTRPAV